LALGDRVDPVQFYTNITPGGAAEKLALLKSPTFAGLFKGASADHEEDGGDLATVVSGKPRADALVIVTHALRREVGQILRMPEAEVDPTRPLGELGLDSLMGLELHLGIERMSGIQFPMMGASERRLTEVAASLLDHLSQSVGQDPDLDDQKVTAMAATHSASGISVEDAHRFQKKLQEAAARVAQ
jgi:acyl carrier protein